MVTINVAHSATDVGESSVGKIMLDYENDDLPLAIADYNLWEYGKQANLDLVEIWVIWNDDESYETYLDDAEKALKEWDRYTDWYVKVRHLLDQKNEKILKTKPL